MRLPEAPLAGANLLQSPTTAVSPFLAFEIEETGDMAH